MLRTLLAIWSQRRSTSKAPKRAGRSLQAVLWSIWTLVVVAVGYINWHADRVAHHPLNVVGMVVHCLVIGVIGLIVLTLVEMRLQPWRFME